jgi:autotransporter strand-loop-strand O-heptosyltransferase
MKISQINPGHMTIPPDSWGAVEKIIWYYKLESEKKGHEVHIRYINEVQRGDFDIVHVHMWNHALELYEKRIPYIFTCHDHHAYALGKNSHVYQNNILAMRHSELSIVPATYLVDYFDNIPVYLRHGINNEEFYPGQPNESPKLLIVGNNGMGGDSSFDRKGFRYAIEASEKLNIPITVVGPTDCNKDFFEHNNDLLKPNVEIKYDLNDKQLQEVYRSHDILIHASFVEAGHPPLTILEAASSGLPVLTTDCSGDLYTIRVQRNTDDVVTKIRETVKLYQLKRIKTLESVSNFHWSNVVDDLIKVYEKTKSKNMKDSALSIYNKAKKVNIENSFFYNFIDGAFIEIKGNKNERYEVKFIDKSNNDIVYQTTIGNNQWAKCSRGWVTDWKIHITSSNGQVREFNFEPNGKRILISLESSSLGDTLAWVPYVEEFRKKHNCEVVVSGFLNSLFEKEYPNVQFVKPGTTVHNLYALYRIGIWYNEAGLDLAKGKVDYRNVRLQEIASEILGLEYKEILPKITKPTPMKSDKPYICIANHSTSQPKYWNNPTGWQELVDYVKSLGYDVYLLSKEEDGFMGNKNPNGVIRISDKSLDEISSILLGSKGFVGLGSGLSWLAWALEVPTILISGFSKPHQEMQNVHRVINETVCNGCFGRHVFDRGDWNWCPDHKGTERQFECTKSITFDTVRSKIDKILSI